MKRSLFDTQNNARRSFFVPDAQLALRAALGQKEAHYTSTACIAFELLLKPQLGKDCDSTFVGEDDWLDILLWNRLTHKTA